ncbi:MAG: FG-GAP-like repeat-containing protein [Flavobacteriaceae bacterium]
MNKKLLLAILVIFINTLCSVAQISFTESATSLGITTNYYGSAAAFLTGGVSFCDFDGDGWDDLTFATETGNTIKFFKNNGGNFTEISNLGPIFNSDKTLQINWVDYDNDGDKDLFVVSHSGSNKLYQNDGSFTFTDVTFPANFDIGTQYAFGASWGDYNNDGYLDVFITYRDESEPADLYFNTLYKNKGDGTFEDVSLSAALDVTTNYLSFCSVFFDYDNDGWQDIYIANDKENNKNIMYHNNGDGTFTDTSVSTGTDIGIDAMATTISDCNNDGFLDIYVTNTSMGNVFFENNGDGTFTDVASTNGTLMETVAWGAVFLDADNDMDTDLYVSSMMTSSNPMGWATSLFYENQGNDTFAIPNPVDSGFDADDSISYSNAIGDVDNDGYPDIVVVNRESNNYVFKNNGGSNNYLKVKLEGTTSNRDGIGSWIQAYNNGVPQNRYTLLGEGFNSQNSNSEFFGLGSETMVDSLKVKWLSGTVDVLYNVSVNQTLLVVEGSSLSVDKFDLSNALKVYPNPSNNGRFQLNFSDFDLSKSYQFKLFDALGRKLKQQNIDLSTNYVDLKNFNKGIYFLQIISDDQSITKKLIFN